MKIHCPQCDYERHVDDDKLPASACMATCPKCAHRFKFRECIAPECMVEPASPACSLPTEGVEKPSTPVVSGAPEAPLSEEAAIAPASPETPVPPAPETPEAPAVETSATERPAPSAMTPPMPEEKAPIKSVKTEPSSEPKNMWDDLSNTVNRWDSKQGAQKQAPTASPKTQQNTANHAPSDNSIPWENLGVYSFFQGLILTIKLAAMSPASFFGNMAGKAPLSRPLTFFVLLGVFQAFMERLWYATLANTITSGVADPQLQKLFESVSHDTNVFITLLVSPFMLTLQVFILAGLYYLMFRFVRPDKADFNTIFRVMCYAAAPTVICVLPIVGPVVASFVYLIWTIIGCKHALALPWSRVFMAVAPLYLLAIALILQVVHMLITSITG